MHARSSTPGDPIHADDPRPAQPWQLRVAFWGLIAIAGFYLISEHRAHLQPMLSYLPFLLLAACPLLHLFGHGGHGHGATSEDRASEPLGDDSSDAAPHAKHHHGEQQP